MNIKVINLLLFFLANSISVFAMELSVSDKGKRPAAEVGAEVSVSREIKRFDVAQDQKVLRIKFSKEGEVYNIDKDSAGLSGYLVSQQHFVFNSNSENLDSQALLVDFKKFESVVCECFINLMHMISKHNLEQSEDVKKDFVQKINDMLTGLARKLPSNEVYEENVCAPLLQELLVLSNFMMADQVTTCVRTALAREILLSQQEHKSAFFFALIDDLSEDHFDLDELLRLSRISVLLNKVPVRDCLSLELSSDGSCIAVSEFNGLLKIIDTHLGKIKREISHPSKVRLMKFSSDGSRLFTHSLDGFLRVVDIESGSISDIAISFDLVFSMEMSQKEKFLGIKTRDKYYCIHLESGQIVRELNVDIPERSLVNSSQNILFIDRVQEISASGDLNLKLKFIGLGFSRFEFSPDKSLVGVLDKKRLTILDSQSLEVKFRHALTSDIRSMQFSLDGSCFIMHHKDNRLCVVDIKSGKFKSSDFFKTFYESDLSIAIGLENGKNIKIIDKVSGNAKQDLSYKQIVYFLRYCLNGKRLITLTGRSLSTVFDSDVYELLNFLQINLNAGQKILCVYIAQSYLANYPVQLNKQEAQVFRSVSAT